MRKLSVALLAGAAIVAGALPAQAKVAGAASINGPGLGGGISIRGDDGAGYPVMSGLLEDGARATIQAPTEKVGPRYMAIYDIRFPKGEPSVIQYLYPFAEGGPLVYTPPGQEWIGGADGTAPSGWFTMDPELLQELRDRGLPEASPVPLQAPAEGQPQPAPARGPSGILWATILLAGLLVAGAVVGRRRVIVRRAA
jgi:hypothetical protein